MGDNICCICGAKFSYFNQPKVLSESKQDKRACSDCVDILWSIKSNRGSADPYVKRLYEEGVTKLGKTVNRKNISTETQAAIDEYLGFPLMSGRRREAERDAEVRADERKAFASMLITSGFNFEGYRITKYSGYISGDDVVQVERGTNFLIGGGTDTGSALSDALVKIRRNALHELKRAAYDLGCNAVIGVDFDYITLEPETANIVGGTTYMPYVFCVTANGNAVVIEKIED